MGPVALYFELAAKAGMFLPGTFKGEVFPRLHGEEVPCDSDLPWFIRWVKPGYRIAAVGVLKGYPLNNPFDVTIVLIKPKRHK